MSRTTEKANSPYEGLGIGIGLSVAAGVVWGLPGLANRPSWRGACLVVAWALLSVGAAGTLTELDSLGRRKGYTDIGVAIVLGALAAGGFRYGRDADGPLATVVLLVAALSLILGVIGLMMGAAKLLTPQEAGTIRPDSSPDAVDESERASTPSVTEKWALALAAGQFAAGVIALFR